MSIARVEAAAAELAAKEMDTVGTGDHGAMPRQDAWDFHGTEMHPQQFVRLIGCHDPEAATRGRTGRPHRTAA